jgi:CBS-domain-containing membrane protein
VADDDYQPAASPGSPDRSRRRGIRVLRRLQLRQAERRIGRRNALALYVFLNGAVSMALMAGLAHFTRSPLIFPSLGPTAFLLFHRPLHPASSPRNTIIGHLIGALAGWVALALFGLLAAPTFLEAGVTLPRIGAVALSLGLTNGLMVLLRASHPPAGATTLIVSLGLMTQLWELAVLMLGVGTLVLQALVINRTAGVPYPLWARQVGEE